MAVLFDNELQFSEAVFLNRRDTKEPCLSKVTCTAFLFTGYSMIVFRNAGKRFDRGVSKKYDRCNIRTD